MSKDNHRLGSFILSGIPPAPAGVESIDEEYDIDANGILKVTATSTSSGSKKSITVDANLHGELSRGEIEDCIMRAELMASMDMREELRVIARNNFDSYCIKMQLESTNGETLNKIDNCLEWIRENPGASQKIYEEKHKALKKHISGHDNIKKSRAECREEQLGLQECHKIANRNFDCKNYIGAFEWFLRCYHIASAKKNETVMKLAILKIGKALTSYAEQESSSYSHISGSSSSSSRVLDIEKYLLRGAQWLVFGLMSFRCNDRADEMIEELSNIKKLLFEKIAPKKSCLESLEYLSQFLFLFHHFDVRCCGEKLRKLMSNSYRDFLNTATLYLEHKVDSCIQGSMIQEKKETLSHLQGLSEPIERLSFIDDLQVESSTNEITAEEFRKFVEISRGTALALHVLHESNINFSKIKVDTNLETDSKVESALYLLDNINDVKKYTKDSLKIFCKLKLLEGKILKVLLSNDELAKDCFREANTQFNIN